MSVYVYICRPLLHVIFLRGRTGVDRHSSKNWCGASATRSSATRPSYYMRGALKTRGGCRASIAHASIGHASIGHASIGHASIGHASILLHAWSPKMRGRCRASIAHAWSPKNGGWVQSVHCPCVEPSHGRVNRPIFFIFFFF